MAHDVAEMTRIERPPRGREQESSRSRGCWKPTNSSSVQSGKAARQVAAAGDDGTNDLLVSDVLRTHEMQVWFWRNTSSIHPWCRLSSPVAILAYIEPRTRWSAIPTRALRCGEHGNTRGGSKK